MNLDELLMALKDGVKSIDEAKEIILNSQTAEMEDVVVDLHREERCGLPEVIYGRVKTVAQIRDAAKLVLEKSAKLLVTRVSKSKADEILPELQGCAYCEKSQTIYKFPEKKIKGNIRK